MNNFAKIIKHFADLLASYRLDVYNSNVNKFKLKPLQNKSHNVSSDVTTSET